jgi:hypothetical protein
MHLTFILYKGLSLGIGFKLTFGKIVALRLAQMMSSRQSTHRLVISTSSLPACAIRITVPGPRSTGLDITSNRCRILGLSIKFSPGYECMAHLPYGLSEMCSLF